MEHNSIIGLIPWPVAAATAAWFGVMAYKAGKNCVVWAIGGGVLALVVTTIVMGLAQATFIPYYTEEIAAFRLKVAGLAVAAGVVPGLAVYGNLAPAYSGAFETGHRAGAESAAAGAGKAACAGQKP